MEGLLMKFKKILISVVGLGLFGLVSPTNLLLAQVEDAAQPSIELNEFKESQIENSDEDMDIQSTEKLKKSTNEELSEEELAKLGFYLEPRNDFDETNNLTHEEINEKYEQLIKEGQNNKELTSENVLELFGEPGYVSSYGDSEFLHYLAIDETSAVQVKIHFYQGEGLFQVVKEIRDINVFNALEMTSEEALDYHENNGITYDELIEKLGSPSQTGYYFNSGSYEAIWVTRAENAGEVQYIAVEFAVPTEDVLSFYSDSSYDALNPSDGTEETQASGSQSEASENSEE